MVETIKEEIRTARKDHDCDACFWLRESDRDILNDELSFSEKRSYIKAKQNGFKIKKGEKYLHQVNKDGGYIFTFKAILEIDTICLKHGFYIYD